MNLPQDTIELVRERADIVEVINLHVPLKKSGKDYKGSCPFHEENTPSFTVSPAKQLYYCFGCGAAGNVFKFLMELGKHSFRDVVLDLAQRYNVPVDDAPSQPLNYPERSRQPSLSTEAPKDFIDYTVDEKRVELSVKRLLHGTSTEAQLARDWLINRGISRKMIAHYQLGLERRIVTPDDDKPDTKETYWAIAIFIPVPDRPGRYYIKKRVAPWLKSDQRPSYLGKWSQFGVKATFFFTYNPLGATETILCEGEWDAILLGWLALTRGEKIAIACSTAGCGAVPSAEELSRLKGTVTSLYDRDEAGQKGAQRLASALEGRGQIALVPMPEDCQIKGWDVSNALDAGYTWEDLRAATLVEVTPPSKPYKHEPGEPDKDAYAEYVARLEEQEWVEEAIAAEEVWSGRTFKELVSKVKRRVNRVFRGFGPPPGVSAPPQEVIDYVPGSLPTSEEYAEIGAPKIRYQPSMREQLWLEAVQKGWKHTLDTSAAGSFKSTALGQTQPNNYDVTQLWLFSQSHRNPSTETIENGFVDLPPRHNGMFADLTRTTPSGRPHVRWPKPGERPTEHGNCMNSRLFAHLAEKGYTDLVEASEGNPICMKLCPFGKPRREEPPACVGQSGRGFGFRGERAKALKETKLRLHVDSAPLDIPENTGAFWDEASQQVNAVKTLSAHLPDFDRTWADLEAKLPEIHSLLSGLRLALRPLLTGEERQPHYGWNHNMLMDLLGAPPADMMNIINQLRLFTQPDWGEVIKRPDRVDQEASQLSDEETLHINRLLRGHARDQAIEKIEALPSNWLLPMLQVWTGELKGALRIENRTLTIFYHSSRVAYIALQTKFNLYLDATLERNTLALHLEINSSDILLVEVEPPKFHNLHFIHIPCLGLLGHDRSPHLLQRLEALKAGLDELHPDIPFIDHKAFADQGWWFNDNRATNRYKDVTALAAIGSPVPNIGVLQAEYITLTGDTDIGKDAPGFSSYVQQKTQAEFIQFAGRPRAHLRPDEQIYCYLITRDDISFLLSAYPGCSIEQRRAVDIAWEAGTPHQQNWWKITSAIAFLKQEGQKLTQQTVAGVSNVAQSTISWLANGNWKKIIEITISSPNSTFDKILGQLNEQEQLEAECIAEDILPVLADASISPDDWAQQLYTTACAYGVMVFRVGLALAPPLVQSKIIAALLGLLPVEVLGEIEATIT